MPVKLDKMQEKYEEAQKGDLWTPDEGETLLYVHPPCRDDDEHEPTDGLCYIPIRIHYSVGSDNAALLCLDQKENSIIDHPFLREELKKRGVHLSEKLECPVCKAIYEGRIAGDDAKESRAQDRSLWGVTPVSFSRKVGGTQVALPPEPTPYMCGWKIFSALMSAFSECGDITDPDSAILCKLVRKGSGLTTKYDGSGPDLRTAKNPLKLDKGMRRVVREAMRPDGDCDLFSITASFVKSEAEAQAAVTGIRVVTDEPSESEPAGSATPGGQPCFGKDCTDDAECRACEQKVDCAEKCGIAVPGGGTESVTESGGEASGPEAASTEAPATGPADDEASDDTEIAALQAKLKKLSEGKKAGKAKK